MARRNRKTGDSLMVAAWKKCGGVVTKLAVGVAASCGVAGVCHSKEASSFLDHAFRYSHHVSTAEGLTVIGGWGLVCVAGAAFCLAGKEVYSRAKSPGHPQQYKKYYTQPTLRR